MDTGAVDSKPNGEAATPTPAAAPSASANDHAAPAAPTPASSSAPAAPVPAKLSRDILYPKVKDVVKGVDVDTVTVKMVARQLNEKHGYDFDVVENKELLKEVIGDILAEDDAPAEESKPAPAAAASTSSKRKKTEENEKEDGSDEDDDENGDDDESESDDEKAKKKKATPAKKEKKSPKKTSPAASSSSRRASAGDGESSKRFKWGEQTSSLRSGDTVRVDEALQKIIFVDSESRINAVKLLMQYVRANNLIDRGKITCDENLKATFGEETLTEAALNKKIDEHLLLSNGTTLAEARNNAKAKRKKTKKEPLKEGEEPRKKKNTGFNKMKLLSPQLADFLGKEQMSRGDVVKALHEYFKAHDLQDKSNKSIILFDEKLQQIFKCKKTTFFKLNKLLVKHLASPGEVV